MNTRDDPPPVECIVDTSAILAGIADLRQWIRFGSINIYVPLHTLNALQNMRKSDQSANEALQWLDEVSDMTSHKTAGRVELQGPEQQYKTWQEVENHRDTLHSSLVSRSLECEDDVILANDFARRFDLGDMENDHVSSLHGIDAMNATSAPLPPISSQANGLTPIGQPLSSQNHRPRLAPSDSVPPSLRDLLNFVVWRSKHDYETANLFIAGLGSNSSKRSSRQRHAKRGPYILLTNDEQIREQARRFEVKANMLSQLKNTLDKYPKVLQELDTEENADEDDHVPLQEEVPPLEILNDDDDEEVVFNPAMRPGSGHRAHVMDPDHFGRRGDLAGTIPRGTLPVTRGHLNSQTRGGSDRGGRRAPARGGRGTGGRGRGNQTNNQNLPSPRPRQATPARGTPRGPTRGDGALRGRSSVQDSRGTALAARPARGSNFPKPMDPDSYARPRVRGRGGRGKLWEPGQG